MNRSSRIRVAIEARMDFSEISLSRRICPLQTNYATCLTKVVDATVRIAGGDFTAELGVKSKDEIGKLADLILQFRNLMANTALRLKKERTSRRQT